MSEFDPGSDRYADYGTTGLPGGYAIVAQYAGRSQVAVVDVNHGGFPGTVGTDGDRGGRFVVGYTDESGATARDTVGHLGSSVRGSGGPGGNTDRMDMMAARYAGR
jgi:hypothetical protein